MMSQLNIGVIGIGAFGSRVALRLLWSGYHTLAIYDVADVATRLFTNDYGGMAQGFAAGGILIDLGNTDPVETVNIAKELATGGIDLVAAPAFGTPAQAKEGKLTLVVGGPEAAVTRCQPVLETIAAKILRADAAGAAQAASAIADYLRAVRLLAASEAIRLGQRFGFEPATGLDLSDQLGGGALDTTLRREVVTRRIETGVQLGLVRRNLDLAARLAV